MIKILPKAGETPGLGMNDKADLRKRLGRVLEQLDQKQKEVADLRTERDKLKFQIKQSPASAARDAQAVHDKKLSAQLLRLVAAGKGLRAAGLELGFSVKSETALIGLLTRQWQREFPAHFDANLRTRVREGTITALRKSPPLM